MVTLLFYFVVYVVQRIAKLFQKVKLSTESAEGVYKGGKGFRGLKKKSTVLVAYITEKYNDVICTISFINVTKIIS